MRANLKSNPLLKAEREKRGWSQARVAQQIDTESVNVSRWERGFSSPSPYYREKLCKLFEKDAQDLGFLPAENSANVPQSQELVKSSVETLPQQELVKSSVETLPQAVQAPPQNLVIPTIQTLAPRRSLPSGQSRMLAVLSYLFWWVGGLPLLLFGIQDDFVLFHSLQSVLLFGPVSVLEVIFFWVLDLPMPESALVPLAFLFIALNMIALPIWIVAIVQAAQGKQRRLPFIGRLSERLAFQISQRSVSDNVS